MSRLTPREAEVLRWVAAGKTTREIACILKRSHHTIEKHRANIIRKLGINTVAGLAVFYNCEICKNSGTEAVAIKGRK